MARELVRRSGLWTNLWIRGVKALDKTWDELLDNSFWIIRNLSTICPQKTGGFTISIHRQRGRLFGLDKVLLRLSTYPRPFIIITLRDIWFRSYIIV